MPQQSLITSAPRRLREIDRLRGLAILGVFCSHYGSLKVIFLPFGKWADSMGRAGVQLFFVISGFLICRSLREYLPDSDRVLPLDQRIKSSLFPLVPFAIRRIFRLGPVAALFLGVNLVCSATVHVAGLWLPFSRTVRSIFAILTLQYNLLRQTVGTLSIYWSLIVEEHFYIFLAVSFIVTPSRIARLRTALVVIALVAFVVRPLGYYLLTPEAPSLWVLGTPFYLDFFLYGVALAFLNLESKDLGCDGPFARRVLNGMSFVLAAIVLCDVMLVGGYGYDFVSPVVIGFAATGLLLLASWEQGSVLDVIGVRTLLEVIGRRSYIIYLAHYEVDYLLHVLRLRLGLSLLLLRRYETLVGIAILALVVELVHRYLEKPCIRIGARLAAEMMARRISLKATAAESSTRAA